MKRNFVMMLVVVVLTATAAQAAEKEAPAAGSTWTEPKTGMEFVWVPAGCFDMGSNDGESNEQPVHRVCVKGFYLGKYEVTQAQYRKVMGKNPSAFKGEDRPVEKVSWHDAKEYIEELSYSGGAKLRLPNEAEWEYACRAGEEHGTYCGAGKVDLLAWYDENSGKETHPVGQLRANAFGLYDMNGNVWEWVEDRYHGNYTGAPADGSAWTQSKDAERMLRGGSWSHYLQYARVAIRVGFEPASRINVIGFRLAMTLP